MNRALPKERNLTAALVGGDRRALARAITLVESANADDIRQAGEMISALLPRTGGAVRIGITGPPGAGKSTFIEAFGLHLVAREKRVAVLAVDPSSSRSGGSILGDKTRMADLARHPHAYIRPSPSRGTLGGIAGRTREAMLLCEAAGYDVVIVETVGVGQSETAVADMVDLFILILSPGGGDELQGLKRGIVELAELVIVNKADGDLAGPAKRLAAEYQSALSLLRPLTPSWRAEVAMCSALERTGIDEIWQTVQRHQATLGDCGEIVKRRQSQAKNWLWRDVSQTILEHLRHNAETRELAADLEDQVAANLIVPAQAAARLIEAFRKP
ncbi:MAG: methylmalonyl Co-A mutase-associated GTPase MeaB [Proteobacteria bacterium]|nr:methylmalonyl Co-A mutase-associated GTPase MeaB [Pseudomonadota bacterium]